MDLPSRIFDLSFLDVRAKRNILGGNAQRLFNLDPVYSPVKLARKAPAARVAADTKQRDAVTSPAK
jgi:uncharacterized protein